MAIVEMKKLNLVAMSYDLNGILDALSKTGAVQVTVNNAEREEPNGDEVRLQADVAESEGALHLLCQGVENYIRDKGLRESVLQDGFDVTYSEFLSAGQKREEIKSLILNVNRLTDEKNLLKGELLKAEREIAEAEQYRLIKSPFKNYVSSARTHARLGVIPTASRSILQEKENELYSFALEQAGDVFVLFAVSHLSKKEELDELLSSAGFTDCPYKDERTGEQVYAQAVEKVNNLKEQIALTDKSLYDLKDGVRGLKIYCEYLLFELEKCKASTSATATERTVTLHGYAPAMAEEKIREAVSLVTKAYFLELSEPSEEDQPPTLLKNNPIVENFESITNTYSTPNYREFDPNGVMAFFYSLFMGFIIGDAGYGILMALVGGYLWWSKRKRPTGMSRLAGAFAIGGLFAIVWGLLFNSLFGFAILPKTVMPDPQSDFWSIAGIKVPSVLVISLIVGIFQLFVGYICKAVQCFRRKETLDGIFQGLTWAVFSVGLAVAIVGFIDEANLPYLRAVGGITAGASLLLAVLTAGRKEKFFGKITKGFGAVYGIINYASDILSYARLYGLMLSGAVIAKIVSDYGGGFIASGNIPLIVLGVLLLVIGHGFNLVMNLLGAYIHDARLQYVEFYGRFYEGEGEMFAPLGSKRTYVYLLDDKRTIETQ